VFPAARHDLLLGDRVNGTGDRRCAGNHAPMSIGIRLTGRPGI
jgi:hypothetical protein